MTIWGLALKEILHRKLNFALALLSVTVAVACLVGAMTLLGIHDLRTRQVLETTAADARQRMAQLEDDMRKAMLGLGFNIVILPKAQSLQDWHAQDYAAHYMPEQYSDQLAKSKIVTVQHLLPTLQQRVMWPERKRTIILVGSRGELPGGKKPMAPTVAPGKIILGHELHQSLALKTGDTLALLGRDFVVQQCYSMRGNKDDITVWIDLKEAQELLDKKGLINAILALECHCAFADLPKVRQEITRILPDTQVIERGSEALARAEVRRKAADEAEATIQREQFQRTQLRRQWERFASILLPLVMAGSVVWIGLLTRDNVRNRRSEIAILRAWAYRGRQILALLLSKAIVIGVVGGALGLAAGYWGGVYLSARLESAPLDAGALTGVLGPLEAALAVALAPLLAGAASWIPAISALRQDPAVALREE